MENPQAKNRPARRREMEGDPYQKLLSYAFWLLGRKAYAEKELERKLREKAKRSRLGAAEPTLLMVLARLRGLNYLNDRAFVQQYLESRIALRPRGKFYFLRDLSRRGIGEHLFHDVWKMLQLDEEAIARRLLEQRKKSLPKRLKKLPAYEQKKKLTSWLLSRGFEPELVFKILSGGTYGFPH